MEGFDDDMPFQLGKFFWFLHSEDFQNGCFSLPWKKDQIITSYTHSFKFWIIPEKSPA